MHAAQTLGSLAGELKVRGWRVQVVGAYAAVRDRLRAEGLDDQLGQVDRFTSVADAVDAGAPGHIT